MASLTLTNAAIKRLCGGKAEYIIQIVSDMVFTYAARKGTIGWNYDEDGRADIRRLLHGEYIGDGSKIWSDGVFFVHYDGKKGSLNLGEVRGVKK